MQQQQQVASEHRCKTDPKELKMTVEKGAPDGTEVRALHQSRFTHQGCLADPKVAVQ